MKFFVGLFLGVGLGAVVGLLLAPQSGETTRALLTEQFNEQGIQLRTGDLGSTIRARASEALVQGRELYARTKEELADRYNQAKSGNL